MRMTSTSVFNLHAGIFSAYCLLPFLLPWRFSRRGAMPRALSAQGCRLHGLPNGTRMHPFWRSCAPDIVRHSYPPRNTFHSSDGRPVPHVSRGPASVCAKQIKKSNPETPPIGVDADGRLARQAGETWKIQFGNFPGLQKSIASTKTQSISACRYGNIDKFVAARRLVNAWCC